MGIEAKGLNQLGGEVSYVWLLSVPAFSAPLITSFSSIFNGLTPT